MKLFYEIPIPDAPDACTTHRVRRLLNRLNIRTAFVERFGTPDEAICIEIYDTSINSLRVYKDDYTQQTWQLILNNIFCTEVEE